VCSVAQSGTKYFAEEHDALRHLHFMRSFSYNTATCHFKLLIYIASCDSTIGERKICVFRQHVNFVKATLERNSVCSSFIQLRDSHANLSFPI